ncbi:nuclear transport factor 2 family protein [Chelativorans sp.]|uniref:nuclear transport factor 2 family protein n=1 Tax=Chelativorans sp. TaxID=2203393 RepID=UPI0028114B9D|nr:nuclear transport factor 2 family protein [Chelativorans sp.]
MELEKHLQGIERRLWSNDAPFYKDSLVEEAVLVFPETGPISRDTAVEAILRENAEGRYWAEVEFTDTRVREITPDVALLTYRVAARWAHETSTIHALASSLYICRGEAWKLTFHQQSPIEG